jgi:hypothetical protein
MNKFGLHRHAIKTPEIAGVGQLHAQFVNTPPMGISQLFSLIHIHEKPYKTYPKTSFEAGSIYFIRREIFIFPFARVVLG